MRHEIIQKLRAAGIDDEAYETSQILCLPENILHTAEGAELLETTDLDALSKSLKQGGASVFSFIDAGIDLAAIDRRSSDKWFGTVWIRDKAIVPILVTVIAGLTLASIDRMTSESVPPPPQKVHIELIIENEYGHPQTIKYDGDGPTLIKILESLDGNGPKEN